MRGVQYPLGMGRGYSRDEFYFSFRIIQSARYMTEEFLVVIEILGTASATISGDAYATTVTPAAITIVWGELRKDKGFVINPL